MAQRIAAVEARVGEVYPQLADSVGAVSAEERVTREAAEAEKRAAQVAAAELAEAQAAATAAAAREAEERRRAEAHAVAEKLREEQAAKARAKEAEKKAEESKVSGWMYDCVNLLCGGGECGGTHTTPLLHEPHILHLCAQRPQSVLLSVSSLWVVGAGCCGG